MSRLFKAYKDRRFIWVVKFFLKRGEFCMLAVKSRLPSRQELYLPDPCQRPLCGKCASPAQTIHICSIKKLKCTNSQLSWGFLCALASVVKLGPLRGNHFALKRFIVGMHGSSKVFMVCGGCVCERERGGVGGESGSGSHVYACVGSEEASYCISMTHSNLPQR